MLARISRAAPLTIALLSLAACNRAQNEAATPQVPSVAYTGARLITGDGSPAIENGVFVVAENRFTAVGPADQVEVPEGATRVDLGGATVIPALVDSHVHLNTTREALIADLQQRARFGVGAAFTLGSDDTEAPLQVRNEVIPGAARFGSAGLGITSPEPGRRQVHWVKTEEEARAAVRAEQARGVRIVKIWVDDRNGQYEKLSPALYRAVIDEAHKHDQKVAAHIFALADAKELLRAGVDIFGHGVRDRDIDDEFVALIKARPEVVVIANLPNRGVATDLGWLSGALPAEDLAKLQAEAIDRPEAQKTFGIQARNLDRLAREGVTIALGTDGNTPWAPHVELEDMVASGLTPAQALVAATRNAAAVVGFDDIGTLAPGKSADFLVLAANPLEDITRTRQINAVYLRGEQVERSPLPTP